MNRSVDKWLLLPCDASTKRCATVSHIVCGCACVCACVLNDGYNCTNEESKMLVSTSGNGAVPFYFHFFVCAAKEDGNNASLAHINHYNSALDRQ